MAIVSFQYELVQTLACFVSNLTYHLYPTRRAAAVPCCVVWAAVVLVLAVAGMRRQWGLQHLVAVAAGEAVSGVDVHSLYAVLVASAAGGSCTWWRSRLPSYHLHYPHYFQCHPQLLARYSDLRWCCCLLNCHSPRTIKQ